MTKSALELLEVTKYYGDLTAVNRLSFAVAPGEFFTLLGPSGCGKTTTLRLVAGLEEPDQGEILLNGVPVASPKRGVFLPPDKRQMAMVFQSYAIWPHMTVFENVAFPLRVRGEPASSRRQKVAEALELVGLSGLGERGATELSGGQQQRVALARALVYTPTVLLLDEPFSNLDAKLREQMRAELRALQRRLKLSVLYVTHDQTEAMTLSDRIGVVRQGGLEQIGSPAEIYEKPATSFVGDFLGRTVVLEGRVRRAEQGISVELVGGDGRLGLGLDHCVGFAEDETVRVVSRPEDIRILPLALPGLNQVKAKVKEVVYLGDRLEYSVSACGRSLVLLAAKQERYPVGAEIVLEFDPKRLTLLRLEK